MRDACEKVSNLEPVFGGVAKRQQPDARQLRLNVKDTDDVSDEVLLSLEVGPPDAAAGVEHEHDVGRFGVTTCQRRNELNVSNATNTMSAGLVS